MSVRTSVSANICKRTRGRLAPSAVLTASSLKRAAERASMSIATFTQATNNRRSAASWTPKNKGTVAEL
jgi:hypothetical protein